jgi:glucokinase
MNYIGIDIGGTNIKGVLLDDSSPTPLQSKYVPTPPTKDEFISGIAAFAKELQGSQEISGVGVGVPGMVDSSTGRVIKAPRLPFLNDSLIEDWFPDVRVPIHGDNDSRLFLRAEARWGAAVGRQHVVGLAIGTGIGGGMLLNGKMYRGAHFAAGEMGHIIVQVTSGGEVVEWESLASLSAEGEQEQKDTMIGIGIANIVNIFDPELVVLGGGAVTGGVVNLDTIRRIANKHIVSPESKQIPIMNGKLGYFAAAMGAGLLFEDN